jgi:UDP-galactopyranose mutase
MHRTIKYDYIIVGAGLFGATCAYLLSDKKVLVIDKRDHIGGNVYTELNNGIHIHKYGAHIFHTSDKQIWEFVNSFVEFEQFQNSPIANYNGKLYNLPINMHTFYQLYGIKDVTTIKKRLQYWDKQIKCPTNLEEYAIKTIGKKGYETLIKGYTEKQWGTTCDNLPIDIIKRIPTRPYWDNNYYDDKYQGIPVDGYTTMIEKMLTNADLLLNTTFDIDEHYNIGDKIIYCGSVDELFDYSLGKLPYRSLQFIEQLDNIGIGVPVMNFTSADVPYTRIIDHKMFLRSTKQLQPSILTYEYPITEGEPYYPIITQENMMLYAQYVDMLKQYPKIVLGGRLGLYKYIDMDDTIELAMNLCNYI